MAKQLSILYVTSEIIPFAKVGILADISYSFSLAVRDFGHDLRVMLPKYGVVSERKNKIHEINRLRDIAIPIGKGSDLATVKSSSLNNPRTKVQAYITTNSKYFDAKKGFYSSQKTGDNYADNDERFIFFSRTVIETCMILGWYPDIIHCNGWQSSVIPAYAKILFPDKFKKTKFLFTIHDFLDQGVFPESTFDKLNFPASEQANFIHDKSFNFMKAGIQYADYITTISQAYSDEILNNKDLGNGLTAMLKKKKDKFRGVNVGIDNWTWNPETDTSIKEKLGGDFIDYKYANKRDLLNSFGLEYDAKTPVIGVFGDICEDAGYPVLIEAANEFMKSNVKMVIFGEGETEIKKDLRKLARTFPGKIGLKIGPEDNTTHNIIAGSDMFLMPGKHEPSGLYSLYALAYGTVPVVRNTGGLSDFIAGFNAKTKKGNGFAFKEYTAEALVAAVNEAMAAYDNKENWLRITDNALKSDTSWNKSVIKYDEIYRSMVKEL